jgi:hypothetical protein
MNYANNILVLMNYATFLLPYVKPYFMQSLGAQIILFHLKFLVVPDI